MRPGTVIDLASEAGIALPMDDPTDVYEYANLTEFLKVFWLVQSVLATPQAWARLAFESLIDGAEHGLIYRETFFTPTRHLLAGQSLADIVAAVDEGLTAAEQSGGAAARLIFDIDRELGPAVALDHVEQLGQLRRNGARGIERAGWSVSSDGCSTNTAPPCATSPASARSPRRLWSSKSAPLRQRIPIRPLVRHRRSRPVDRRRARHPGPAPIGLRRQSTDQERPLRRKHHPATLPPRHTHLLRTQDHRRQVPTRRPPSTQTPPRQPRHPSSTQVSDAPLSSGGAEGLFESSSFVFPHAHGVHRVLGQVVGWIDADPSLAWLQAGEANVGYTVFAAFRGNGYAARAVRLLADDMDEPGVRCGLLVIDVGNLASLGVARAAGATLLPGRYMSQFPTSAIHGLTFNHRSCRNRQCGRGSARPSPSACDTAGRDDPPQRQRARVPNGPSTDRNL